MCDTSAIARGGLCNAGSAATGALSPRGATPKHAPHLAPADVEGAWFEDPRPAYHCWSPSSGVPGTLMVLLALSSLVFDPDCTQFSCQNPVQPCPQPAVGGPGRGAPAEHCPARAPAAVDAGGQYTRTTGPWLGAPQNLAVL